jgi:hypothetical protein
MPLAHPCVFLLVVWRALTQWCGRATRFPLLTRAVLRLLAFSHRQASRDSASELAAALHTALAAQKEAATELEKWVVRLRGLLEAAHSQADALMG